MNRAARTGDATGQKHPPRDFGEPRHRRNGWPDDCKNNKKTDGRDDGQKNRRAERMAEPLC
jgi:hypothetical protein